MNVKIINKSLPYWIKYIKYFYEEEGIKVDGLWIVSANTVISNNNALQKIKKKKHRTKYDYISL
jgi:hypothetical protein